MNDLYIITGTMAHDESARIPDDGYAPTYGTKEYLSTGPDSPWSREYCKSHDGGFEWMLDWHDGADHGSVHMTVIKGDEQAIKGLVGDEAKAVDCEVVWA